MFFKSIKILIRLLVFLSDKNLLQVFQRRFNGIVNFNRSWTMYEQGFGSVDGEFWLGK